MYIKENRPFAINIHLVAGRLIMAYTTEVDVIATASYFQHQDVIQPYRLVFTVVREPRSTLHHGAFQGVFGVYLRGHVF
ncbi:hypothetical protein JTE90_026677 [Oedothorax gibbosus]|uniref:Uncharacterized protein n=1 Tax=Oedothorax gibbosus TaxID=931172 RepID=A0AAV6V2M4_9ARAC|nr:hypothetical protein JTE90_026677 [Oedothorax gibbosus]